MASVATKWACELPAVDRDRLAARAVLVATVFALAIFLINPVGYVGGGQDDFQYLNAARCGVEHGYCLPHDHWWRRWPLVAPITLALRILGDSGWALAIVPLTYALAGVALLVIIVARQFGNMAGALAGIVFAATPLVSQIALEPGVDLPELAFVLAAILCLQNGLRQDGRRWFALAGLAAGMAIQTRPTALALVPVTVGLLLLARRPRAAGLFVAAVAVPSIGEALAYAIAAHDPLLGWRLSLAHGRVPSSELLPGVDTRSSPLFNPAFIAGWKRPMGIHVHWTVDGLLNYVLSPSVAVTLGAALALLALEWRRLRAGDATARALTCSIILAVVWFGTLTYGLAVDPKPRMFMVPLASASAILAVLLTRRWHTSRLLVATVVALILAKGLIAAVSRTNLRAPAAAAPAMIAAGGRELAIDPRTAQFLALVPAAVGLPNAIGPADRRPVLLLGFGDCERAAREEGYTGWRTLRSFAPPSHDLAPLAALRRAGVFVDGSPQPVLCTISAR